MRVYELKKVKISQKKASLILLCFIENVKHSTYLEELLSSSRVANLTSG